MKALWIKIVLLAVALPGVWGNVAAQVTISADFDTGSIGSVRRIDSVRMLHAAKNSLEVMSFGIRSRIDPLNPVDTALLPSSRWFHFRLEGVKGKLMFLHIPNTEMVRPFYSYDGEEYLRFDAGECSLPQTVYKYFLHDTVYVAYFLPYSHARHKAKADEWACSPFVRRQRIGRSGEGRPIEMLILTDDTVPDSLKRRVWIHSRVHTSEAPAAWHLEAMIDELLSDAPLSREILRRTVFYVVPETNPDGVRGGYSRSTAQGVNLEINWDRPDSLTQPEVRVLKRTIDSLSTQRPFDVALNLHSQSAPFVTYWIHTAKSTSAKMYRRKMLLSALTIAHTPYYRPIDQRFSEAAPRYAEGWFWQRFGERTLAVTFETPYTYYNNDPAGEWVSRESLAELAHASLLALSDLLDLGGSERRQADSERMKARGKWLRRTAKDRQFFGGSYLVAERKGASVSFVFPMWPKVGMKCSSGFPDRWIRNSHARKTGGSRSARSCRSRRGGSCGVTRLRLRAMCWM